MKEEQLGYIQEFYTRITADLSWIKTYGGWAIAIILFLLCIVFADRLKQIKANLLGLFALFGWFRRSYIGNRYESEISIASKALNKELGAEILPSDCKINWVKETTRENFIKDGKVVVKLSYIENMEKNYVNAVVGFLQKGLLLNARNYVSPEILKSSELVVAKKIITESNNSEYVRHFIDSILYPIIENDPQLKECINNLNILDSKGLFMQVFLPELLEFGDKLFPCEIPNDRLYEETRILLEFLVNIARREFGVVVELGHVTSLFNIRIMIIGKAEKINAGIEPYITAFKGILREGYKRIYILAEGKKLRRARQIVDIIAKMSGVGDIKTRKMQIQWPDGRHEEGLCYVVTIGVVDKKIAI